MKTLLTTTLTALALLTAAGCSEDNNQNPVDPGNQDTLNGTYQGIGTFITGITVDPTGSPQADDCEGDITVVVDDTQSPAITGSGNCLLQNNANAASFTLEGDFTDADSATGTLTFTFSGKQHTVPWSGDFADGLLSADYAGRTEQTATIDIDWDGVFDADID